MAQQTNLNNDSVVFPQFQSNVIFQFTAGEDIIAGDPVFISSTDGKAYITNATTSMVIGLATSSVSSGSEVSVAVYGVAYSPNGFSVMNGTALTVGDIGKVIRPSATKGSFIVSTAGTLPIGASYPILGRVISANKILITPFVIDTRTA